jgi:hypothetical protein
MANNRLIRPGFFVNPGVSTLSIKERYLLMGLTAVANDWGKLWFQPIHIRSQVFPTDEINLNEMNTMLDNIVSKGFICVYQADEVKYAHFPSWRQQGSFLMQYLDKPRPDADIPDCPRQHDEKVLLKKFSEVSSTIEGKGKETNTIEPNGRERTKEKEISEILNPPLVTAMAERYPEVDVSYYRDKYILYYESREHKITDHRRNFEKWLLVESQKEENNDFMDEEYYS